MESNIYLKEKIKKLNLNKNAKTLVAVHTHTHTHTVYCLLVNEDNVLKIEYKNKDRTVLNV